MTCRRTRRALFPLLDGELRSREATRVREHLDGCADCRAELRRLETLVAVIERQLVVEPSPGFDAGFRAKLAAARAEDAREAARAARRPQRLSWKLVIPGMALAGALAAALFILLPGGTIDEPPRATAPASAEEIEIARALPLLKDLDVVENLDALEDYDVVARLHELPGIEQDEDNRGDAR